MRLERVVWDEFLSGGFRGVTYDSRVCNSNNWTHVSTTLLEWVKTTRLVKEVIMN